jgi:hypothetical protein
MAGREPRDAARTIAVALHGIEPATFERCALIRDWLHDHGVSRVTLLVIPARDLHPVGERSPQMVAWSSAMTGRRRSAGARCGTGPASPHGSAPPAAPAARIEAER